MVARDVLHLGVAQTDARSFSHVVEGCTHALLLEMFGDGIPDRPMSTGSSSHDPLGQRWACPESAPSVAFQWHTSRMFVSDV